MFSPYSQNVSENYLTACAGLDITLSVIPFKIKKGMIIENIRVTSLKMLGREYLKVGCSERCYELSNTP